MTAQVFGLRRMHSRGRLCHMHHDDTIVLHGAELKLRGYFLTVRRS